MKCPKCLQKISPKTYNKKGCGRCKMIEKLLTKLKDKYQRMRDKKK